MAIRSVGKSPTAIPFFKKSSEAAGRFSEFLRQLDFSPPSAEGPLYSPEEFGRLMKSLLEPVTAKRQGMTVNPFSEFGSGFKTLGPPGMSMGPPGAMKRPPMNPSVMALGPARSARSGVSGYAGFDGRFSSLAKSLSQQRLAEQQMATGSGPSSPSSFNYNTSGTLSGGMDSVLRWSNEIANASTKLGVPQDIIAAIMTIESGGDPGALSVAGATGLMQVMPNYHSGRTANYGGGSLSDPQTNIYVGAEILAENYARAKEYYPGWSDDQLWTAATAAYLGDWNWNAGTFAGSSDAYGTDGGEYVQRFREARAQYNVQSPQGPGLIQGPDGMVSYTALTGGEMPLTQEYGHTKFSRGSSFYGEAGHTGYDFGIPEGTPLYAPVGGEIVTAGGMGGYGTAVYMKTEWGYLLLGHMSGVAVNQGQVVAPGTLLGYSGNTGASTGAHLHLETRDHSGNPFDASSVFAF